MLCDWKRADVGVGFFIVLGRKAVKTVRMSSYVNNGSAISTGKGDQGGITHRSVLSSRRY